MTKVTILTLHQARQYLTYCSETGVFSRIDGKSLAHTPAHKGYIQIVVNGLRFRAHRLAWAMHYGAVPEGPIDHINGAPSDNRISNLRIANGSENQCNRKIHRNNTSGVMGVYRTPKGRWYATINVYGVKAYLGTFSKKDDAIKARRDAESAAGYHVNHGKR